MLMLPHAGAVARSAREVTPGSVPMVRGEVTQTCAGSSSGCSVLPARDIKLIEGGGCGRSSARHVAGMELLIRTPYFLCSGNCL